MLGVKPHCEDATQLKRLLSRGILAGMEEASFPTNFYVGDLLNLLFFFFFPSRGVFEKETMRPLDQPYNRPRMIRPK